MRDDTALVVHEVREDTEFKAGELYGLPIDRGARGPWIENQTADLLRRADNATGVRQDQRGTVNDTRDQRGTADDTRDQRETVGDAHDQRGTANDAQEPTSSTAKQQPPSASSSGNGDQPGGSQSEDSGSATTDSSHTNENP